MNDIKHRKRHYLSLQGFYPRISRTLCRVLQIWTSSPNTPDTAPSLFPSPRFNKIYYSFEHCRAYTSTVYYQKQKVWHFHKNTVRVYFKKLEKQTLFMSIQPSFSVLEFSSFSHASETCTHTRQFDLVHRCVGFLVLAVSLHLFGLYKVVASQGD